MATGMTTNEMLVKQALLEVFTLHSDEYIAVEERGFTIRATIRNDSCARGVYWFSTLAKLNGRLESLFPGADITLEATMGRRAPNPCIVLNIVPRCARPDE